ncbi:cytochrome c oxidase subunit 3 [Nocardioides daeguensis]|uniref:Cytochrome c oxidase subunit 3 family protein n=1 Tax=Nocardioides daeguensis TaxID=908359 RepID=A0ABP6USX9_9ACTN|nr:cytochrome c oxidase subunit 3 [Nocardioides daeguensis]MBV6725558.1 cytochrome c oxidase subunit 3 [Nocardioides daeguensis]MCR1771418.1 cytochrome c oxidase subunit 3 [Nocardioides daeguensis]
MSAPVVTRPSATVSEGAGTARRVPGEPGVWLLVLLDMSVFAVLFVAFLLDRRNEPEAFAAGQADLTLVLGLVNTLVLVTSSALVAGVVRRSRAGVGGTERLLLGSLACGVVFGVLKVVEWAHLLDKGVEPDTGTYSMWFFVLTGLHLVHLLIGSLGLVTLLVIGRRDAHREVAADRRALVEVVATYWHMVDLLWLVIFPLVYLGAS